MYIDPIFCSNRTVDECNIPPTGSTNPVRKIYLFYIIKYYNFINLSRLLLFVSHFAVRRFNLSKSLNGKSVKIYDFKHVKEVQTAITMEFLCSA